MNNRLLSYLRGRGSMLAGVLGLACGFVIRDETSISNLSIVDSLIVDYDAKDYMIDMQERDVMAKIDALNGVAKRVDK